jgi:hypothetical protein
MLNLTKGRLLSVACALLAGAPSVFGQSSVQLNEILASNLTYVSDHAITDWVELINTSPNAVDLSGASLSDDEFDPTKWSFPPGTSIPGNGYLLVACDPDRAASDIATEFLNTGFGIKATGMNLYLFGQNFGELWDSVSFGSQVADLSIGRVSGTWRLCTPTPKAANVATQLGSNLNIKINEWMANPASGDDWFELYNPNALPAALSGLYLTDTLTIKDMFPIAPLSFIGSGQQAYVQFLADGNTDKGPEHAGFKLSNGGEAIGLYDGTGREIDSVTFGAQAVGVSQGRLLDGSATITTFPGTASPNRANYKDIPNIVVNELLAHTDPPLEDAVEFYNTGDTPTNIGGWFLSNKEADLKKYRIPDNTIIPAKGYLVIYEKDFNTPGVALSPFTFNSAHGDQVYLAQADASGNLTGYRVSQEFEASENGVSFGRVYTTVTNDFKFVAMASLTFGVNNPATTNDFVLGKGAPNSLPKIGPVVFNEVHFNPLSLDGNDNREDEFIELYNITSSDVPLYDVNHPENHWRLQNGVTFVFPGGRSIPAFGYALVVSFDPDLEPISAANFRARWNVPDNVDLYGPFTGDMNNNGDSLELYKPDPPQTDPHPDVGFVPYIRVDKVNYTDRSPWPSTADGTGFSLQRINSKTFGNDPINWAGATPTPGTGNDPSLIDTDVDGMPDAWEQANGFDKNNPADGVQDADNDGMKNRDEFLAGTNPHNATSKLVIRSIVPAKSEVDPLTITFAAAANKTYTVEYRGGLDISDEWHTLKTVDADTFDRDVTVEDPEAILKTDRYYRIIVR